MPTQDALGLVLLQDGIISQSQLYQALQLQRQTNRLLGSCLVSLGYISAEVLLDTQSRLMDLPAMAPGLLADADPQAVARVPQELCLRLRIVPYSWDGEVLGVALADERVLEQLGEVAQAAQAAVGACIALESDIDAALMHLFGRTHPKAPARVIQGPPPRAPAVAPVEPPPPSVTPKALERTSFYDAIAHIYEQPTIAAVGACIGSALLNYFCRVLVFQRIGHYVQLTSVAGAIYAHDTVALTAIPTVQKTWENQRFAYGSATDDGRGGEVCRAVGMAMAPTSLLAVPGEKNPPDLLVYADNGDAPELYEDIHDIALLLKEADTALSLLRE